MYMDTVLVHCECMNFNHLVLAPRFWKHFQAELPLCKPDWEQFQEQVFNIDESTIPLSDTGMGNNCALSWIDSGLILDL